MAFSLLIGIPSGILAAVRWTASGTAPARSSRCSGCRCPRSGSAWSLILFFSVYLGWLPSSGSGTALHLLMPAFALGWYFAAAHMRLTRSSMLEVLGSEYVKLARLKGLPEALVIAKHAFKNALIPVLTLAGINLVIMVNVAVVVETVFAWPGIGRLLYEGIAFRDFPVVQATVLLGGAMIVVVNLVVDILYAVIDPRIRYGEVSDGHPASRTRRGPSATAAGCPPPHEGLPGHSDADPRRHRLLAIFANVIAPYDPEIGSLGDRFRRRPGRRAAAPSTCSAPITSAATCSPG